MSKSLLFLLVMVLTGFLFGVKAGAQDNVGRPSSILDGPAPLDILRIVEIESGEIEDFCNISQLPRAGWALINNSQPLGLTNWFQGNPSQFPAHTGDPNCYIAANFRNAADAGTISNWLLTPELNLGQLESCSFFTRSLSGNVFPDRLEVRISTNGASTDVGGTALSVGDFTRLVIEINPNLQQGGYPQDWTEFIITPEVPGEIQGRIAFRYFVTNGGPDGLFADYIGIDTTCVLKTPLARIPTLSQWGLIALAGILGIVGFMVMRRRKVNA